MQNDWIAEKLDERKQQGLFRQLTPAPATGAVFEHEDRRILNFSSNDYLNLACNPLVVQRSREALEQYGTGATASRLLAGNLPLHEELEQRIAAHKGKASALLFGSGYLTNLGIIGSFLDRNSILIADKLIHACILDAGTFTGCRIMRFRHNDANHLESILQKTSGAHRLIAVESVYSMNGDLAPLKEITELARRYDAALLVDEAHAYGVRGPCGSGLVREYQLQEDVDFSMGTLSKAIGSYGGYVACGKLERDWMINHARSLIYTTALPPAALGAALGALEFLEQHPDAGQQLLQKASFLAHALKKHGVHLSQPVQSQILPVRVGNPAQTLAVAQALRERGIWAFAIRPPTVPASDTCLRFSVGLAHSEADLERAAATLADILNSETFHAR